MSGEHSPTVQALEGININVILIFMVFMESGVLTKSLPSRVS